MSGTKILNVVNGKPSQTIYLYELIRLMRFIMLVIISK